MVVSASKRKSGNGKRKHLDKQQINVGVGEVMSVPKPQPVLMESFEQLEQELLNGHMNFIMCYEAHKTDPETKIQETITIKNEMPIPNDEPMAFALVELVMRNPRIRILKV